jgi:hypothetical protein
VIYDLKLPVFAERELAALSSELSPVKLDIRDLLYQQGEYNKKVVTIEGRVETVVSIDETDKSKVASWFIEIIPTTVETTASATYFYIQNDTGNTILIKYPADVDVAAGDNIIVTGYFTAHAVTIETKGFLRTKKQQALSPLGEPFITALIVENQTKQKTEYIRKTE